MIATADVMDKPSCRDLVVLRRFQTDEYMITHILWSVTDLSELLLHVVTRLFNVEAYLSGSKSNILDRCNLQNKIHIFFQEPTLLAL